MERTLSGSVFILDHLSFNPNDPINSGGGVPVTRAAVTIVGPDGTTIGSEVRYPAEAPSYGAGRFVLAMRVRPGARYQLTVRTLDGTTVTGSTLVPNAAPVAPSNLSPLVPFNRDRDSLAIVWNAVPFARTYGLRADSPFGAFLLFTDTTRLKLSGDIRNVFASNLQRLFIPGFRQTYTVFAVDTNFFDYYRSRNDPFTGSGIINHLSGGIGLFGSSVNIVQRTLDVTQQPVDPVLEGEYELVDGPAMDRRYIDVMRLYVETTGPTFASLSGWYSRDRNGSERDGIAGARDGKRIVLELLDNQDSRRKIAKFSGTQDGDSLVGTYDNVYGRVVLRKRAVR